MGVSEINDMNIIALAGTIARIVIVTKYCQAGPASDRNLRNERHQIVRYVSRIFSD